MQALLSSAPLVTAALPRALAPGHRLPLLSLGLLRAAPHPHRAMATRASKKSEPGMDEQERVSTSPPLPSPPLPLPRRCLRPAAARTINRPPRLAQARVGGTAGIEAKYEQELLTKLFDLSGKTAYVTGAAQGEGRRAVGLPLLAVPCKPFLLVCAPCHADSCSRCFPAGMGSWIAMGMAHCGADVALAGASAAAAPPFRCSCSSPAASASAMRQSPKRPTVPPSQHCRHRERGEAAGRGAAYQGHGPPGAHAQSGREQAALESQCTPSAAAPLRQQDGACSGRQPAHLLPACPTRLRCGCGPHARLLHAGAGPHWCGAVNERGG